MLRELPSSYLRAYPEKGKTAALVVSSQQVGLLNARVINNSGGAITAGIMRKLLPAKSKLFTLTGGGVTVTNVTPTAQSFTAITAFTTTNNDGLIVQSDSAFGLIGFTVSDAGAAGTYAVTYWNGSSFAALTTIETFTDLSATGDKYVVFRAPLDWVVGGPAGVDATKYSVRIAATTAPGDSVQVNALWLGEFMEVYSGVANNSGVQLSFPPEKPFVLSTGEGIFPYFGTAAAANMVGSFYVTIS